MSRTSADATSLALIPSGLLALHLVQTAVFSQAYPLATHDPDLFAYFVYFRNWLTGNTALHDVAYFTVPKPLLVLLFGPFGSVPVALVGSALVSGLIGVLVYRAGTHAFGWPVGLAWSLLLLLDSSKAVLAMRSMGDLYVGTAIFAAIVYGQEGHHRRAAVALLLAALVKPVVLPCALYVFAVPNLPIATRLTAAALPFAALPVVFAANHVLLGTALGAGKFFAGFDALGEDVAIGAHEVVHFIVWRQLVNFTFLSTSLLGFVGLIAWLTRRAERYRDPLVTIPMLVIAGYTAFAVVSPYVPFFRFFWVIEVWFAGFIVFAAFEIARRLAGSVRLARVAVTATLLAYLADDWVSRQAHYAEHYGEPNERAMTFVSHVPAILADERRPNEAVMTSLAFLPYLMWELGTPAPGRDVVVAEELAARGAPSDPAWIVYVPYIHANRSTKAWVDAIVRSGRYEVRLTDGESALLVRTDVGAGRPIRQTHIPRVAPPLSTPPTTGS